MNNPADEIQAQNAPLSHLSQQAQRPSIRERLDWRSAAVAVAVVVVIIIALLWRPVTTKPQAIGPNSTTDAPSNTATLNQDNQLPPFAQTQRELARTKAQDALAEFVELQIKLEETMQVDSWGGNELTAAMAKAQLGDEEFVAERYETSLDAYRSAATEMRKIIELGEKQYQAHLQNGIAFINERSPKEALAALNQALTIKPDDNNAQKQYQRAQQLPEIIRKLRTAKNHELGGRYQEALAVYKEIEQLDPLTSGLEALKTAAAEAQAGNNLTSYLSAGFSALSQKRFNDARRAFNQALVLDPNNNVAQGGLQQVAQQNDLAIIADLKKRAENFISNEQWQQAIDEYQAVLKIDSNIQFALNGRNEAQAHLRAQRLLSKIAEAPQKLSSEKLYLDAEAILEDAQNLSQAGPTMKQSINEVERLLALYRDPVDVVLLSDNATEVIMSNVGRLGFFERKTLNLRPGQYTIRGSQNGCRDIFLNIEVLPGIAPLDISCAESLDR